MPARWFVRTWRLGVVCSFALSAACHRRAPPSSSTADAGTTATQAAPPDLPKTVPIERETDIRESSGLVLGRIAGARRAFLADEDDAAIVEIDLDGDAVASSTALPSRPRDLIVLADGTIAATLPDANAVVVLAREERGGLREVRRSITPVEPIAIGLSPDDATLYVSTGASHSLVAFASPSFDERHRWDLPREPRAVLVAGDGKRVFVSHAAESVVSVIPVADDGELVKRDIGHGPVGITDGPSIPRRHARNAFALVRIGEKGVVVPTAQALPNPPIDSEMGFLLLPEPMPMKSPGAKPIMRPSISGYGMSDFGGSPVIMDLSTIDGSDGSLVTTGEIRSGTACLLPRAAVAVKDRVIVACLGSDRLEQFDNPHGRSAMSLLRTTTAVAKGPSALAAERDGENALVWSTFARKLSRVTTTAETRVAGKSEPVVVPRRELRISSKLEIPRMATRDPMWLRGRELFFSNHDFRISSDGRACASCHPDGRDDGITWATPKGPRRTRTLAGQLDTGPYGWLGEHRTLEDHVKITFRQLGGTGLPDEELAALLTYVRSLPKPPAQSAPDVARGKALFANAECENCHGSGASDRNIHDVGTGGTFMTPTLAGIGARRQMMHDGRFKSLDDLLVGAKSMGTASALSADDRHALVSYLETL